MRNMAPIPPPEEEDRSRGEECGTPIIFHRGAWSASRGAEAGEEDQEFRECYRLFPAAISINNSTSSGHSNSSGPSNSSGRSSNRADSSKRSFSTLPSSTNLRGWAGLVVGSAGVRL